MKPAAKIKEAQEKLAQIRRILDIYDYEIEMLNDAIIKWTAELDAQGDTP